MRGATVLPPDVVDLSVEQDIHILGPLASLKATLEHNANDLDAVRGMIERLNAAADGTAAPAAEKSSAKTPRRPFQTYVSIYVPLPGSTPQNMQWKQFTAVSRDLSVEGMSVMMRDDIRTPLFVTAFNPCAGTRLSLKALVNFREQLPEGV